MLPIYRQREVGFITKQTKARLLVVPSVWKGFDFEAMANEVAGEVDGLDVLVCDRSLPEGDASTLPPPPATPDDPADLPVRWLFYTSGTTADPKGAQHTDRTVMAAATGMNAALDLRADDVGALVFPFTHIGGIVWLLSGFIVGAGHLVRRGLRPRRRRFRSCSATRVTLAGAGTPFHLAYLAAQRKDPGTPLFPNIRAFPGGGAPKPPQLHYDLKAEIGGVGIVSGYGLTECPILSMARTTDPDDKLADTEGPPTQGVQVRVVTLEGKPAGSGEEGEIRVVRAPALPGVPRRLTRCRRIRRRGLVPHRRPRKRRRRGLHQHHRPPQGHHHPQGREHQCQGDRGPALHPPQGG